MISEFPLEWAFISGSAQDDLYVVGEVYDSETNYIMHNSCETAK